MTDAVSDRALGCLVGLAVGDALGTTLEFSERDELPYHRDITGGGPFDLQAGQWTDDTSMALALGESLLHCRGFDAEDLMQRFQRWRTEGEYSCTGTCFDIGMTTADALRAFQHTGNPFAGPDAPDTAGNGSIMRLAPVALYALQDAALASQIARDQSRTTHGALLAVEACDFLVTLQREAILGRGRTAVLSPRPWSGHPTMAAIASSRWVLKQREQIRASGYVIHTLEAALWSVAKTNSFEDALLLAVNLGEDADTVGAVTGQIAGALYGASAIPARWLAPLAWRDRIETLGDALLKAAATAP